MDCESSPRAGPLHGLHGRAEMLARIRLGQPRPSPYREARAIWRLPILRYRSVPHHSPETAAARTVPVSLLEEHLHFLTTTGWKLVGVTEARQLLEENRSRPVIALSFDDALLDFLNAYDLIRRFGARATLYVPTGAVGRRASRWEPRERSHLGWDELAHLGRAGVEIGSRAVNARAQNGLRVATDEVQASKNELEDRLGLHVESFCYPAGVSSAQMRSAISRAGYASACTTEFRVASSADDVLALPRLRIRPNSTGAGIEEQVQRDRVGFSPPIRRTASSVWHMTCRTASRITHGTPQGYRARRD